MVKRDEMGGQGRSRLHKEVASLHNHHQLLQHEYMTWVKWEANYQKQKRSFPTCNKPKHQTMQVGNVYIIGSCILQREIPLYLLSQMWDRRYETCLMWSKPPPTLFLKSCFFILELDWRKMKMDYGLQSCFINKKEHGQSQKRRGNREVKDQMQKMGFQVKNIYFITRVFLFFFLRYPHEGKKATSQRESWYCTTRIASNLNSALNQLYNKAWGVQGCNPVHAQAAFWVICLALYCFLSWNQGGLL